MARINVRKLTLETTIDEKQLPTYEKNGWKRVELVDANEISAVGVDKKGTKIIEELKKQLEEKDTIIAEKDALILEQTNIINSLSTPMGIGEQTVSK